MGGANPSKENKNNTSQLLLEHYPKKRVEASEHPDFVMSEFRDMKMRPLLERALRHKEILKA